MKKQFLRIMFLAFLLLISRSLVYSQQRSISGIVVDTSGEPIPGVSIIVKGSEQGTISDLGGKFSLQSISGENRLVFSFVGMKTQEILIGQQSNLKVTMLDEAVGLSDVIVVGYGTQQRRNVVSAISTVDSKAIEKTNSPSFIDALQGVAPGLQISSSSGNPDGAIRMLIRGVGSINTAAEPLVLVDGFPVMSGGTNSLNFLNPSDIESISVLKDASATAIYGSRGANGVILVTTKSGKKGGGVNFSYEHGFTKPIIDVELADANEWRSVVDVARKNSGLGGVRFEKEFDLRDPRHRQRFIDQDIYNTTNTDWLDLYSQNGSINKYSFSFSDATENTTLFMSGQYRNQTGNVLPEKYETYTGRINFDYKINKLLKAGIRYTYILKKSSTENQAATNVNPDDRYSNQGAHAKLDRIFSSALPIYPVYWPDNGEPFDPFSGNNLVFSSDRLNSQQDQVFQSNLASGYLEFSPIKNLVFKGEYGLNYSNNRSDAYTSGAIRLALYQEVDKANPNREFLDYVYTDGVSRFSHIRNDPFTWNAVFSGNYRWEFDAKHNFNILAGIEANETRGETHELVMENASSLQEPDQMRSFIRSEKEFMEFNHLLGGDARFFSAFSRLNYDYLGKYILQATLRYDGSSKFSPEDRFSWFPSVSGGWVLSEESFLTGLNWLSNLKIRGSRGVTGNANIPGFLYIDNFSFWANYPNKTGATLQETLASKTIQWEKSTTTDASVEFGFWKNRLSGSFGFYNTRTTNLLMNFPTAASIGIYGTNNINVTSLGNVGEIDNKGIELQLRSINITAGNFNWSTDFNITTNKNRVVDLYPGFDGNPTQLSFNGLTTVQIGQPMGTFYLPVFGGYDQYGNPLIKEIDQEKAANQIYEFTGNLVRPIGSVTNNNRVIQYGKTGLPTWFGGLNNSLSYKGLTLSVLVTFQGGNYLYDDASSLRRAGLGRNNFRKDLLNSSWTPDNTEAQYPVLSWQNMELNPVDPNSTATVTDDRSTHYLKKGDFARLRTISISYDFQKKLVERLGVKGLNVYVNTNNIATISAYKDFDPEQVNTSGDAQTRNIGQGVVNAGYWQVFSANFGVNVTF